MAGSQVVQSVVRAAQIIRLISESADGLGVGVLAERLGLKPPTVHHQLRTLVATELLERAADPVRYRIGPLLRQIGSRQMAQRLHEAARPVLRGLAVQLPEANLIVAQYLNGEVVATLRMSADQPGILQHCAHQPMSAYSSASALLFQACWPAGLVEQYRRRYPFAEYCGSWSDLASLEQFLQQTREQHFALRIDREHTHLAVAAPIFRADQTPLATIGASLHVASGAISLALQKKLTRHIRTSARQITMMLDQPAFDPLFSR